MDITSLLFPLLILLLFIPIFLSGRRQRRQAAETKALQEALEVDDVVITTSGLRGTVVDASYEETIDLEIADGVITTWVRAAIREKVTPVADDAALSDGTHPEPALGDDPTTDAHADPTTTATTTPTGEVEPATRTGSSASAEVSLEKGDSPNGAPRS